MCLSAAIFVPLLSWTLLRHHPVFPSIECSSRPTWPCHYCIFQHQVKLFLIRYVDDMFFVPFSHFWLTATLWMNVLQIACPRQPCSAALNSRLLVTLERQFTSYLVLLPHPRFLQLSPALLPFFRESCLLLVCPKVWQLRSPCILHHLE